MKKYLPYYTKKEWKRSIKWPGRVGYYLGIIDYHLDYQVWKPHFRYWNPLAIVFLLFCLIPMVYVGFRDLIRETTIPKSKRTNPLKNAL